MAIAEASEVSSYPTGRAVLAPSPRVGRRDKAEAIGLLLGILGVLLVVVVTFGAAPGPT